MQALALFRTLANPVFARLYAAQTISLLGDALTWVGIALLAFELSSDNAAAILAGSLTLRVTAFVVLSPLAGAIADWLDRKQILVATHLARMVVVSLLPLVDRVWQVYALILALNLFNAFFTPAYQATLPQVTGAQEFPQAIALASSTNQLLGVLGPGMAGAIASWIGPRQIFFLDGLSFLVAAVLILTLPGQLRVPQRSTGGIRQTLRDIKDGTARLFTDAPIRHALFMESAVAVVGAQILVNTVSHVKGGLQLGDLEYGWVMSAFGIGASLAALAAGILHQQLSSSTLIRLGGLIMALALLPANWASLAPLLGLWLLAGFGQIWVELPVHTIIAEHVPSHAQGRVYGAHFAWSHFWWALAYPLAGWLGNAFVDRAFFWGAWAALGIVAVVQLTLSPELHRQKPVSGGFVHEHEHFHDSDHDHDHAGILATEPHTHLHHHP